MSFNIGLFAISLIVFHFVEHKSLLKEWFLPLRARFSEFISGYSLMAFCCIFFNVLILFISKNEAVLNPDFTWSKLGSSVFYDFNSVVFEELIFRGVAFYFLLKYMGKRAILISAILFGTYHWFTQGVMGNIPAMLMVFLLTGTMGYIFALAFYQTRSILLPVGLHLGWNSINHNLFSNGPNGEIIFHSFNDFQTVEMMPIIFIMYLVIPVIAYFFLKGKFAKKTAF